MKFLILENFCCWVSMHALSILVKFELLNLIQVKNWELVTDNDVMKLQHSWKVKSFTKGLEFFQLIANVAEAEGTSSLYKFAIFSLLGLNVYVVVQNMCTCKYTGYKISAIVLANNTQCTFWSHLQISIIRSNVAYDGRSIFHSNLRILPVP